MKVYIFFICLITSQLEGLAQSTRYTTRSGFCSTTLTLKQDNTFNYEGGCERSSHTSSGTWFIVNDTIFFKPIDLTQFKIIDIQSSHVPNSKMILVTLLDQNGKDISRKFRLVQTVEGKGDYPFTLDSSKTIQQDYIREGGQIKIKILQQVSDQNTMIKTNGFTNFIITVNIPSDIIYSLKRTTISLEPFKLLRKKGFLQSIDKQDINATDSTSTIIYTQD